MWVWGLMGGASIQSWEELPSSQLRDPKIREKMFGTHPSLAAYSWNLECPVKLGPELKQR